jgi:hypothetical protein
LSHGDADGKIMTDQKTQGTESYETFTTASVFEALKYNALLKDALKLVFLGVIFLATIYVCFQNTHMFFKLSGKNQPD